MVRIGDKLLVKVEVAKIVEDKDGIHYVVVLCGNDYDSMRVKERDLISLAER